MRLQFKILLIFTSVALLLGGPLLLTVRNAVRQILLKDVERRGVLSASSLAESASAGLAARREQALLPLLQSAQERAGAMYAEALGLSGEVLAHTNVTEKGKIYDDAATLEGLKALSPVTGSSEWRGSPVMLVSVPVWSAPKADVEEEFLLGGGEAPGRTRLGTVRLGLPLKEVFNTQRRLFRKIAAIVLMTAGIGLSLVLILMRRLLRPIKLLSRGTSQISRGEYGVSVPVLSKDELGRLAEDFNRMSRVLGETTVSKNFLGDVLSHMIDPLIVMTKDGVIRMVNQATIDLLGYAKEELEGRRAPILFVAKDKISDAAEQETLIGKGSVRNLELDFLTKTGVKVPVLFSSSTLKDTEGRPTGIIAVAKDMRERKKLEGAIRQSEKLSAVGQLAAGVAHEINNPLGVILGFAQAVVRRLQPNDPLELPLKSIEKEAVRCKGLVQDLLTFSRVSKIDREPLDVNRAVEGALSLVIAQARLTHVDVRKELAPDLPRILGNLNQIQQIIVNLANNALDAMGDAEGLLTFKTENLKEGPLSWVCLKVLDTGPGIPGEIQSRIFDPFFTTKPVGKGTGLGLSLVHEIIKKHSGTIDVESRPGRTEFCAKFPVRAAGLPISPANMAKS
ncbi:MAG: hypothetical protein A2992_07110 [Elusimicrobia bacterium RIFCSPLOWO2_01_FULL_59_12]|nr:MAG: hypothetical protein A2992_07110 [Elusimicrobia bacterium RIFCSPLOWO2_01_FULL_59_12]